LDNKIRSSGYCPKGRIAEDGILDFIYPLRETITANHNTRTLMNVIIADGTLIIFRKEPDHGTRLTMNFCKWLYRPLYFIDFSSDIDLLSCKKWLDLNRINVLNIAGPRESSSPGIYRKTYFLLEDLFTGY
jgi:hypothetical protein